MRMPTITPSMRLKESLQAMLHYVNLPGRRKVSMRPVEDIVSSDDKKEAK